LGEKSTSKRRVLYIQASMARGVVAYLVCLKQT